MSALSPFAFGKLPAHGDFVARGLTDSAREAWDHWASAGLELARQSLAERFETLHLSAPPWRFRFGPGRFGPSWRTGAFAPSMDRSGRRFVIVLGVEGDEAAVAPSLAEALEDAIYQGLGEGRDIDGMMVMAAEAALSLAGPDDRQDPSPLYWTLGGADFPPQTIQGSEPPADLITRALTPATQPEAVR